MFSYQIYHNDGIEISEKQIPLLVGAPGMTFLEHPGKRQIFLYIPFSKWKYFPRGELYDRTSYEHTGRCRNECAGCLEHPPFSKSGVV